MSDIVTNSTPSLPVSDRPGLLIAMVSGDTIVLAKLVRTLCPLQVLLFRTAYARQKGWTTTANDLLHTLIQSRPEILQGFRVIDLPEADLPVNLEWFRHQLVEAVKAAKGAVAFDCTTGQSLFHVLGFDTLRHLSRTHHIDISAVYIHADTQRIVRVTSQGSQGAEIGYDQQPTEFRYTPGIELVERFGIYGATVQEGRRLWPNAEDLGQNQTLCRLYDALCQQRELRVLFHSYWSKLRRWKQHRIAAENLSATGISAIVQASITRFAISLGLNEPQHHHRVRTDLAALIKKVIPGGSPVAWLERYLADNRLSALQAELNRYTVHLPTQLFPGVRNGQKRNSLQQRLSNQVKVFVLEMRQALDRIAASVGHDPAFFSAEEHQTFLAEELKALNLSDAEKMFVVKNGEKLPNLFEACIGCAVARMANDRFHHSVAAVSQNVTLVRQQRSIAELDTLVLFKNADLSVLEAKTHFGNADLKKIEANIKVLRDFGGAYSTYNLVYPLTTSDIQELVSDGNQAQQQWIEDAPAWKQYLKSVGTTRDQRILGLDQLERIMPRSQGKG